MDIIIIDETAAEHQVAPSPFCGFAWAVAILGLDELDLQADEGLNAGTIYIPGSLKPLYACMQAVILTPARTSSHVRRYAKALTISGKFLYTSAPRTTS